MMFVGDIEGDASYKSFFQEVHCFQELHVCLSLRLHWVSV